METGEEEEDEQEGGAGSGAGSGSVPVTAMSLLRQGSKLASDLIAQRMARKGQFMSALTDLASLTVTKDYE